MEQPLVGILIDKFEIYSLKVLHKHINELDLDKQKTYHKYELDSGIIVRNAIDAVKYGKIFNVITQYFQNSRVESIDGMNELYVSSIGGNGSDKVFETMHIDGPFHLLPFCTVLRTIVAIKGNSSIITDFPFHNQSYHIQMNEYIAFDYNSHVHYIRKDTTIVDNSDRIILKLHYIVTPEFLPKPIVTFYKYLHYKYNSTMRTLFLKSQEENTLAYFINNGTVAYCYLYTYLGGWNTLLLAVLLFQWLI
jgi:hypothetical protein